MAKQLPNGSTWTNISGATSASYTTPALASTTYYRVNVGATGSGCSTIGSSSATVTVSADPQISILGAKSELCVSESTTLDATKSGGLSCSAVQWQYRPGTTGSWINLATGNSITTSTSLTAGSVTNICAHLRTTVPVQAVATPSVTLEWPGNKPVTSETRRATRGASPRVQRGAGSRGMAATHNTTAYQWPLPIYGDNTLPLTYAQIRPLMRCWSRCNGLCRASSRTLMARLHQTELFVREAATEHKSGGERAPCKNRGNNAATPTGHSPTAGPNGPVEREHPTMTRGEGNTKRDSKTTQAGARSSDTRARPKKTIPNQHTTDKGKAGGGEDSTGPHIARLPASASGATTLILLPGTMALDPALQKRSPLLLTTTYTVTATDNYGCSSGSGHAECQHAAFGRHHL